MKKAFQSIMAFVLAVMLMTSVCCIPGVFASTETVNTAHLHGTGNATLATDEIFLESGTTYTVSFLWKAVQGDARVQLSGSAVENKTRTLIVDGSYTMSGTDYDWQTGRVTYTFTASGDALVFSALQATNEISNFISAMYPSMLPMLTVLPLPMAKQLTSHLPVKNWITNGFSRLPII